MALLPRHHEFMSKDNVFQSGTSRSRELLFDSNGSRRFSSGRTFPCSAFDVMMKGEVTSSSTSGLKHKTSIPCCVSSRGKICVVRALPETKITKKRIKLLDSYFGKLEKDNEKPSVSERDEIDTTKAELNAEEEMDSLSAYLDKLQKDGNTKDLVPSSFDTVKSEGGSVVSNNSPFQQLDDDDQSEDALNFYAVSILASINVGVCLFEAAAPVRNNDMGLLSLPSLYGAKINDLIVAGEWWRLVTPMFLHSGVAHVALSSWALLTFGPKVCRDYGLFTFGLIYVLGGVSGNFMSFLHTADPTVGGTGPAFALIGAWLVDQSQNKGMIKRDEYDDLFQKAIIMSGLGLILSHFGPIDDWTNLGALIAGIVYGFFTCPVFQLGRESERQEGFVAVGPEKPNNAKSFLVFTIFVTVIVTSLLLYGDGPLEFPTYDDVVYSLI